MPQENVTALPLTNRQAERLLREFAKDSRKLVNTLTYRADEVWFEMVSYNQALLCLKEGRVIGRPKVDEHGNHVCVVHRVCGGLDVFVTFAIEPVNEKRIYILKVENTQ